MIKENVLEVCRMNEKIKDLVAGTTGVIGEIIAEDVVPVLGTEMLKGTVLEAATGAVSAILQE